MGSTRVAPGICKFIFSADLNVLVRCRVDKLVPQTLAKELIADEPLDIEVALVVDGEVFRTAQSSQAVFDASPEHGLFRPQLFAFAIKIRDLPRQCSFVVRLRARSSPRCIYRGVLPLFNRRAVLRQGKQPLALVKVAAEEGEKRPGIRCERAMHISADSEQHTNEAVLRNATSELREALRLVKAADLYERGCLPQAILGFEGSEEFFARRAWETLEASGLPWLSVILPVFPHAVVFTEPQYCEEIEVPPGMLAAPLKEDITVNSLAVLEGAGWLLQSFRRRQEDKKAGGGQRFKCFVDYDAQNEHPAVLKSLRLARSSRSARSKDRDARPNAEELRRLSDLIRRPRRQFAAEEKHLLLRFRWSLTDQPGALTKFLHAVDWSDLEERTNAIELLGHWSLVDIDDALELLGKDFRGIGEVRKHAVDRLERASDEDLQLYLLQLVQALRYEPSFHDVVGGLEDDSAAVSGEGSPIAAGRRTSIDAVGAGTVDVAWQQRCALTWFLIRRAMRCQKMATLFHWYLVAEADDREQGPMFEIKQLFLGALGESSEGKAVRTMLHRQVALRRKLLGCVQCAKGMKRERIEKKVERFRQALTAKDPPNTEHKLNLTGGMDEGIPLPVDPSVCLLRIVPEQCFLQKSAMVPAVLTCEVQGVDEASGGTKRLKKIMVKEGDDLRQDQLILQLIILMDSILKKYGLDLQLTPYQVVALSTNDGMVEFVPEASNLSTILKDHNNDIQQFFRAYHPNMSDSSDGGKVSSDFSPQNSYGIKPEVLENFVRSSAGYCVITYILGVGDRHLDNLMVTRDGRLFHIDFGFILGKDPKPFPPPMRICKEMVEGMGGNNSPGYQSFKSKCCQAYKILRRHAKLIINLLYLMTDSGIKDLCGDPQFAILKVEQKFQALMDDEQAEEHFLSLIEESVSALFPVVMEKLHRLAIAMQ